MVIVNATDTLLKEVDRKATLRSSVTPTSNLVPVQDESDLVENGGEGTNQQIIEEIDTSFQPGISHSTERKEKERVTYNCRRRKQEVPVFNPRETVFSTIQRGITDKGWDCKLTDFQWENGTIICKICDKRIMRYKHIRDHIARPIHIERKKSLHRFWHNP